MKYWSSGEVESSVGDGFRLAMNNTEEKINSLFQNNDYGEEVDNLDVIYIITKDGGVNKLNFKPKHKELDFRVVIDYSLFLNSPSKEKENMLIRALIKALISISETKKTKSFNFNLLCKDLAILMNESGK